MLGLVALAIALTGQRRADVPPAVTPPPIVLEPPRPIHGQIPLLMGDNDQTLSYSTEDNWVVRIDLTVSDGCYAALAFDDGTVLRVGLIPSTQQVYASIGNTLWHSVSNEGNYAVAVGFDGKEPWTAIGAGAVTGQFHAVVFELADKGFLNELAAATNMGFANDKKLIGAYRVTGFAPALHDLAQCQAMVEKTVDPFSGK